MSQSSRDPTHCKKQKNVYRTQRGNNPHKDIDRLMFKLREGTHDLRLQIQPASQDQSFKMSCCFPQCPDSFIGPSKPRLSLQEVDVYRHLRTFNDQSRTRGILINGEEVGCLSCYEDMMARGEDYLKKMWHQKGTDPLHPMGYILPYILAEEHPFPADPLLYIPSPLEIYALEYLKAVQVHEDDLKYGIQLCINTPATIISLAYDRLMPSRYKHDALYIDMLAWSYRGKLDNGSICVTAPDVKGKGLENALQMVQQHVEELAEKKRRSAEEFRQETARYAASMPPMRDVTPPTQQVLSAPHQAGMIRERDEDKTLLHALYSERNRRDTALKEGRTLPALQRGGFDPELERKSESESDPEPEPEPRPLSRANSLTSTVSPDQSEPGSSPSHNGGLDGDDDVLFPEITPSETIHGNEQGIVTENRPPAEASTSSEGRSDIRPEGVEQKSDVEGFRSASESAAASNHQPAAANSTRAAQIAPVNIPKPPPAVTSMTTNARDQRPQSGPLPPKAAVNCSFDELMAAEALLQMSGVALPASSSIEKPETSSLARTAATNAPLARGGASLASQKVLAEADNFVYVGQRTETKRVLKRSLSGLDDLPTQTSGRKRLL